MNIIDKSNDIFWDEKGKIPASQLSIMEEKDGKWVLSGDSISGEQRVGDIIRSYNSPSKKYLEPYTLIPEIERESYYGEYQELVDLLELTKNNGVEKWSEGLKYHTIYSQVNFPSGETANVEFNGGTSVNVFYTYFNRAIVHNDLILWATIDNSELQWGSCTINWQDQNLKKDNVESPRYSIKFQDKEFASENGHIVGIYPINEYEYKLVLYSNKYSYTSSYSEDPLILIYKFNTNNGNIEKSNKYICDLYHFAYGIYDIDLNNKIIFCNFGNFSQAYKYEIGDANKIIIDFDKYLLKNGQSVGTDTYYVEYEDIKNLDFYSKKHLWRILNDNNNICIAGNYEIFVGQITDETLQLNQNFLYPHRVEKNSEGDIIIYGLDNTKMPGYYNIGTKKQTTVKKENINNNITYSFEGITLDVSYFNNSSQRSNTAYLGKINHAFSSLNNNNKTTILFFYNITEGKVYTQPSLTNKNMTEMTENTLIRPIVFSKNHIYEPTSKFLTTPSLRLPYFEASGVGGNSYIVAIASNKEEEVQS